MGLISLSPKDLIQLGLSRDISPTIIQTAFHVPYLSLPKDYPVCVITSSLVIIGGGRWDIEIYIYNLYSLGENDLCMTGIMHEATHTLLLLL